MDFPKGALDGIVILDLTRVLCGPYGTMWLGDMGADIIKIENPNGGDDTRSWGPRVGDESAYFAYINRNSVLCTDFPSKNVQKEHIEYDSSYTDKCRKHVIICRQRSHSKR